MASSKVGRVKIGLMGSGQIGSSLALFAGLKNLGNIAMFDIVPGLAAGKALDLSQMFANEGVDVVVEGSDQTDIIKDSDVVIVTAGLPRKPGMTRKDLLPPNFEIISSVGKAIKEHAPNAFVICITNPIDIMVHTLWKISGVPEKMICGMSGQLDGTRFASYIAEALKVSVKDVSTLVIGAHDDNMIPLTAHSTVKGVKIEDYVKVGMLSKEGLDAIIARTKKGGGEIIQLLKTGSAFVAPASCAILMAESYLRDQKRVVSCSALLNGEYGVSSVFIGVPCVIGKNGVEKIVQLSMTEKEMELFKSSVASIKSDVASLPRS